jgi:hypothetical protein
MPSAGMLGRVALVRTNVSEERLLVTANVVSSSPILVTLMKEALSSSETSVLTRATGVTSQKTSFFIVTSLKTSNLAFTSVSHRCQSQLKG